MDDTSRPTQESPTDTVPPAEQVRTLIGDVRALAEAEMEYVKARLSYSGGVLRKAGLWALLAIFFLAGAVTALILGMLIIVNAYFGPWIATISTVILFAAAAWGSALYARKAANQLRFAEDEENV